MRNIKWLVLLLLAVVTVTAHAQRIRDLEGNPDALKGIKELKVQYDYAGMTIGTRDIPEGVYMHENADRLNEKRPGKGTAWAAAWQRDRTQKLEPAFRAAFQEASGILLGEYPQAKYTLVFSTTHIEVGYNVRIRRKSALIEGRVKVIETGRPDHVILAFRITGCRGRSFDGYDFAANLRLMASYATAGDAIGSLIAGKRAD